ncbi:sensor histidine kinase [Denitromonas ohlonensis]|uniref:histidine kinase n=2 Tax=Denitromonas TaxID=139331 RepID=A0A557SP83_9RHOO|nr:HAMP domain-containing sensor histidine kinase [Denitromonas ohlonensis]TVO67157.1 HAMP domain-containing histidine kinase [Denitromonas ohlonensis]TVO79217.1 HAMP domain-containing histidine kinase [Denitromonas ohlonensis]
MTAADTAPAATGLRDRLRPLWILLPYILPWWLLVPTLTTLLYQSRLQNDLSQLAVAQSDYVDVRSAVLTNALIRLTNDIRLIEHVTRSAHQHLPASIARERLGRFFGNLLDAHPDYAQVRLLDPACHERLRIERAADGRPTQVPDNDLQDKSRRPYCTATQALPDGHIYLSPLDANMEYGRVVLPLQPMLRIATHVTQTDGTPLGIVVLNFDAAPLLASFTDPDRSDAALVDADGYWLHAPDPADAFGFVTGQTDKRLGVRYPALWAHIRNSPRNAGQIQLDSGLWTFRRFAPGSASPHLHAPAWHVLSQIPPEALAEVRNKQLALHLGIAGTALLVLTGLSLALAASRLRQQRTGDALARSNQELAQSLARLEQSQDELVRSAKLASLGLMVAGVAHELNTPLGAAMLASGSLAEQLATLEEAFAEGLRRSDITRFTDAHAAGLALLNDNLQRAAQLIRQFKEVAADRATATRHRFDLADTVGNVLALMHNDLKHTRHRVELDIPPGLTLDSYPGPLGQIVQNLISNAVRHGYTDGRVGHIRIIARPQEDQVTLSVIDDGCGIPADTRERIWDPFFTTRRHQGGTGLGLHLCQHMATSVLGGALTLVSAEMDQGCEFRLTIPVSAPDGPTERQPGTPHTANTAERTARNTGSAAR